MVPVVPVVPLVPVVPVVPMVNGSYVTFGAYVTCGTFGTCYTCGTCGTCVTFDTFGTCAGAGGGEDMNLFRRWAGARVASFCGAVLPGSWFSNVRKIWSEIMTRRIKIGL